MRDLTVLAPDLLVGDVIHEAGLAGITGRVTAVRVTPRVVDVEIDGESRHGLALFEVCRIERAPRAEVA